MGYEHVATVLESGRVSDDQLAGRLSMIYEDRVKRVLYLFPDNDTSSDRIVEVIDKVKHLRTEQAKGDFGAKGTRSSA
jgi:transcription initiation factor IIE alpha subunit